MPERINKYSKVFAEINLGNLEYNLQQIQNHVKPAKVIAVVKANAYGHGVVEVSKHLEQQGIDFFAVARIKEALELYQANISGNLLIFSRLNLDEIQKAINLNFRITLANIKDLETIEECAMSIGKKAIVHINVDTGMGRIGLFPKNLPCLLDKLANCQNIELEGLYSHFSNSDCENKEFAYEQYEVFLSLLDQFEKRGFDIPLIHMANSGAILDIPDVYQDKFNAVRAGMALYGCYPSMETSESIKLIPVMTLSTDVMDIREMDSGQPISYGLRYYTKEPTRIAVLPIGYADGISRMFTNKGKVLTVTMDQIMVAVDNDVNEGDKVILWGMGDKQVLRTDMVADSVGTIAYELCTSITSRVLKKYIKNK